MLDTQLTIVGNLVAAPRLSFTKDGLAVASFRLASTRRRFDRGTNEWRDLDTVFANVTCWRALAHNVAGSLKRGQSVIVHGRLSVRDYETKEGQQRQSVDIDAIAVGADLARMALTAVKPVGARPGIDAHMPERDAFESDGGSGDAAHFGDELSGPHRPLEEPLGLVPAALDDVPPEDDGDEFEPSTSLAEDDRLAAAGAAL